MKNFKINYGFLELGDKTLRKIELEKLQDTITERKTSAKTETDRIDKEIEAYKKEIVANYTTQFEEAKANMKKVIYLEPV